MKLIELGDSAQAVAVISSYAEPLLKGCGTIGEGELRVVGVTEPVPFTTAFARKNLAPKRRQALQQALLTVAKDVNLLKALESKNGFVPVERKRPAGKRGQPNVE